MKFLNQKQLAKAANISPGYLSKILNPKKYATNPTRKVVERLESVTGMVFRELLHSGNVYQINNTDLKHIRQIKKSLKNKKKGAYPGVKNIEASTSPGTGDG